MSGRMGSGNCSTLQVHNTISILRYYHFRPIESRAVRRRGLIVLRGRVAIPANVETPVNHYRRDAADAVGDVLLGASPIVARLLVSIVQPRSGLLRNLITPANEDPVLDVVIWSSQLKKPTSIPRVVPHGAVSFV